MDAAAKHAIQSGALVRADRSVPKCFVAHVADTVVLRPKALVTPFWRRVRRAHRGQSERCGALSGARDVRSAPSATGGSLCGLCGFRCSHRWKGHCGCCRCHRCDCRCTTNHPDRGGRLPDRASLGTRGSWGLTAALLRLTSSGEVFEPNELLSKSVLGYLRQADHVLERLKPAGVLQLCRRLDDKWDAIVFKGASPPCNHGEQTNGITHLRNRRTHVRAKRRHELRYHSPGKERGSGTRH